ncbi:Response regulator PleD [Curvibacter sp. AEP1-3]|uniref:SDR family NAD(P)-dependent oxidoreductase n=1 Tax=Curvibacter sp. AEP1-3 TaxID=1844971 RepID=UPI000B3CC616|nr:SDR family NAD(P)-dependent oxidoreductase [Curvibacter sp. AEP1-3]ARV18561.1 Response regulator PleD [Curvibacter sp. AEP1-3]
MKNLFADEDLLAKLGMQRHSMSGKTALITGSARGIGEHTAYALAYLGITVVIADISEEGKTVANRVLDSGGSAVFFRTDLRSELSTSLLINDIYEKFGNIDILINNAAQIQIGKTLEKSIVDWNSDYSANLVAPLQLMQNIVPKMLAARAGTVISLISLEGMPFMGSYCSSKMALRSLMISLGKEIPAESGVSVFSVMPGAVDTLTIANMISSFSKLVGVSEPEIKQMMSNNPGYEGLVPVAHAAASLAWFCCNAPQFHGQFVDGFLPLSQHNIIELDDYSNKQPQPGNYSSIPNFERDMNELIQVNRSLENRINERTRELEIANKKLLEASMTDPLTGLWNRRYADIAIREEIALAMRNCEETPQGIHLVLMDIDHFKSINDHFGHSFGDHVLKEFSIILQSQCRSTDKIIRWGGEEFLVIAKDIQNYSIESLVERIRLSVENHLFIGENGVNLKCTCSIGFAALSLSANSFTPSWETVVSIADSCMYAAKNNGRNQWFGTDADLNTIDSIGLSPKNLDINALRNFGLIKSMKQA